MGNSLLQQIFLAFILLVAGLSLIYAKTHNRRLAIAAILTVNMVLAHLKIIALSALFPVALLTVIVAFGEWEPDSRKTNG